MNKIYFPISVLTLFTVATLLLAGGCKSGLTGTLIENSPPETHTALDTIIRKGDDRLRSEVHVQWWGDDPDGFVAGFEFTFDNINWTFTPSNDSVFILSPPAGQDTIDFVFRVRAIDNLGANDATPATLVYPIKNTRPEVAFVPGANNPVLTFPVVKLYWQGTDPDGQQNISHFEVVWNDTLNPSITLPAIASSATFIATDMQANSSACEIYLNNNAAPESYTIDGLRLNDTNRLYIRITDQSGALSAFIPSYAFFVKKIHADILVVNAYTSGATAAENFYFQQLAYQGIAPFDTIRIFEMSAGNHTQQSPDNITQSKIFELFETIIWFGNSADQSLSLAQKTTDAFFNKGGKMMMAVNVSSTFDEQSQFLDFTPATSLVVPKDTTLILDNAAVLQPQLSGWPTLASSGIVGVVRPMNLNIGADPLYNATLTARDDINLTLSPWVGNSIVLSRRKVNGKTNFVMSTLELNILNGNNNIDSLFQKILIDEFGL